MPDLPRACVRCGSPYGLTRQAVDVPSLDKVVDLPFCQACWKRVEVARRARLIAVPVAAVTLLGGLVLRAATGGSAPLVIACAICVAVVAAVWFHWKRSLPRYSVHRDAVELHIPGSGAVKIHKK
jgi:hypothetical protein